VAVGAPDLALRNFSEDRLPSDALTDHAADVGDLVGKMIELKHPNIRRTAVDTRMVAEVVAKLDAEFPSSPPSSSVDLRVVPLAVGGMPLTATIPAARLGPVLGLLALVELRQRLDESTRAARLI
jgi:hypothetical protein